MFQNDYCKKVAQIIIKRFQKTSVKRMQKLLPKGFKNYCKKVAKIIIKRFKKLVSKGCKNYC